MSRAHGNIQRQLARKEKTMSEISVFKTTDRQFVRYLGDEKNPIQGDARIARLVGKFNSSSMGAGVVEYGRLTVKWELPFDELITVIEGSMRIYSGDKVHALGVGDLAWFPAMTPLTYEVAEKVVVSYVIYPIPAPQDSTAD
jgi:ethanolamine utilization protein EutQ (cupin superfamily)